MTKNEMIEKLLNNVKNITDEYKTKINGFLKENFVGCDYKVTSLYDKQIRIGFVHGTWNETGNPMYHDCDIYCGYEWNWKRGLESQIDWRWQLNVSAMGSFDMNDTTTREWKYYNMIAQVLQHSVELEKLVKEYVDLVRPFHDDIDRINREIRKEEAEIAKAEEEKRALGVKILQTAEFNESDDNSYIIINKSTGRDMNFIYRKQPVAVITAKGFATENDAYNYMYKTYSYHQRPDFKVVEKRKLKVAA